MESGGGYTIVVATRRGRRPFYPAAELTALRRAIALEVLSELAAEVRPDLAGEGVTVSDLLRVLAGRLEEGA